MTELKRCPKCGQKKPKTPKYFYRNKSKKDGFHSHCKDCERATQSSDEYKAKRKIWRQTSEWYKSYSREYAKAYQKTEKYKSYQRQYERTEKRKAYKKAYEQTPQRKAYHKHYRASDHGRSYRKKYHKVYKKSAKYKAYQYTYNRSKRAKLAQRKYNQSVKGHLSQAISRQRRRTRKAQAHGDYTSDEWLALCAYYDHTCLGCNEKKPLTVDHIVPLSRGGSNDISNIQPLCINCNCEKGTDIIDYRKKKLDFKQLSFFD